VKDLIQTAMHRAPFTPFVVRLVDGRSFTIEPPDFISVPKNPRGRDLVIHDGRTNLIEFALVVSVDFEDTASVEESASGQCLPMASSRSGRIR
jgi:hypothetical protein